MAFVGDGPLDIFSLGEIHGLGDGRGEVDIPLLTFFALDELNVGGESHTRVSSHITRSPTIKKRIPQCVRLVTAKLQCARRDAEHNTRDECAPQS